MTIFKFEPIYKKRIWGGTNIISEFQRPKMSCDEPVGESWEIVDRKENQSVAINGTLKNKTLRYIIQNHSNMFMGPNWNPKNEFPILVKWLDCNARLSLQVHPPENIAQQLNGQPKTENWFIAKAKPNAGLFIGLENGVSKNQFHEAIHQGTLQKCCQRVSSSEGDSILIESGHLHAIDGGNLILEIQQNSDTTYRVYDWDRTDSNGNSRELHIEESLKCINFNISNPEIINYKSITGEKLLANSKHFRIRQFKLNKNDKIFIKKKNQECMIIHLVSGKIKIGKEIMKCGEQAVSPYSSECTIKLIEDSTFLVTDSFTGNIQN